MRVVGVGHCLFAIATAGFALLSLQYGDFAPIWQALPNSIPGRIVWVYGCALFILSASAGIFFPRTAIPSVSAIATYLALWVAVRATAAVLEPGTVVSWYGVCEALAPLVGAWILSSELRYRSPESGRPFAARERALGAARILFGFTCVVFGLAHFAYADYTASMVPAWLPGRLGLAYITGLGHCAAGIGIIVGILPRLAATLEAIMMSMFGLLVWAPSLIAHPPPAWATPAKNQWSETIVTLLLAATAWIVARSLRRRPWGFAARQLPVGTIPGEP